MAEVKSLFPKRMRNIYEEDGFRYIGTVDNLLFDSAEIDGDILFSAYDNRNGRTLIGRSRCRGGTLIDRGKAKNQRMWGYRTRIVGDFANIGLIIPDSVLNGVFQPIEKRLLDIYGRVFSEDKEDVVTRTIKGGVEKVDHCTVGVERRAATLYDVKGEDGIIQRAGVYGKCELLKEGDHIVAEVEDYTICHVNKEVPLEVFPGSVQVIGNRVEYFKLAGWQKVKAGKGSESVG